MEILWFGALFSAMCLEGLGRRYLPGIPTAALYFLKDAILLYGFVRYRPSGAVRGTARYLYRGFGIITVAAIIWTLIEVFNPEQESFPLAMLGLRSYWLWWLAPVLIANVLQKQKVKRQAIYLMAAMAIGISALAAAQFAAPANSSLNLYTVRDGEEIYAADLATVASTGRARVSGTFAYVTGFSDFTLAIPALLFSLGLEEEDRRTRRIALAGGMALAATLPMSGSRTSIVLGFLTLFLTVWTAGLLFTRIGRRVFIAGALATVAAGFAFPDAILGVESRFENTEETAGRFQELANYLPPVALLSIDYPVLGLGTGMEQNARMSLKLKSDVSPESEVARYLFELGPIGFLLVWTTKLGLVVGLLRGCSILKRAGKRGSAGMALSYAAVTMTGNMVFDHNWQALYFTGCGFILAEVTAVMHRRVSVSVPASTSVQTESPPPLVPREFPDAVPGASG
jgi:hypothetical protein